MRKCVEIVNSGLLFSAKSIKPLTINRRSRIAHKSVKTILLFPEKSIKPHTQGSRDWTATKSVKSFFRVLDKKFQTMVQSKPFNSFIRNPPTKINFKMIITNIAISFVRNQTKNITNQSQSVNLNPIDPKNKSQQNPSLPFWNIQHLILLK